MAKQKKKRKSKVTGDRVRQVMDLQGPERAEAIRALTHAQRVDLDRRTIARIR